jgi:hypothetical protein
VESATGRLLALPSNIRQGCKGLPRTNGLAYLANNFFSNVINLGSYPILVCSRKALGLTHKYLTRMVRHKRVSLFGYFICDEGKEVLK